MILERGFRTFWGSWAPLGLRAVPWVSRWVSLGLVCVLGLSSGSSVGLAWVLAPLGQHLLCICTCSGASGEQDVHNIKCGNVHLFLNAAGPLEGPLFLAWAPGRQNVYVL